MPPSGLLSPPEPTIPMSVLDALDSFEPASMHAEVPVVWDRAAGCEVWDTEGHRFLDGCAGIFAANAGHNHPYITAAVRATLERGLVHSYHYPTGIRAALLARLHRLFGYEQAYLCTTGSEAVEAALRIARTPSRPVVVSLQHCFHGKTAGAIALRDGGPDVLRIPLPPVLVPKSEKIAAFIIEPYQGWSARMLSQALVDMIWQVAGEIGALVIVDEVQAGMGRTGRWFGSQHFGHIPDLVVCGKALGNGVPVAAVLGSAELFARVPDLSATHSGHPLGCAAALATLDVLETERLVERAVTLGQRIAPRLRLLESRYLGADIVDSVVGVGAVWALHCYPDDRKVTLANAIVDAAFRHGLLLVRTHAGTVKFGPPLTVSGPELDEMLDILTEAVAEVASA